MGGLRHLQLLDVDQVQDLAVVIGQLLQAAEQQVGAFAGLQRLAGGRPVVGHLLRHLRAAPFLLLPAVAVDDVVRGEAIEPGREGVVRPVLTEVPVRLDEDLAGHVLDLLPGVP